MPTEDASNIAPAVRGPDQVVQRLRWETRLIQEWIAAKQFPGQVLLNLRLGPTQKHLVNVEVTPQLEAMLRVSNWYADAVILLPNEALVIEAKVNPQPSAVGQALFYSRLVYRTPGLEQVNPALIVPMVLFGEDDSEVTTFARQLGCRVEIYTPTWIADYLVQRQFRGRSNPQAPTPGAIGETSV